MPDQSSAATEHALLQEITAPLERLPVDPLALVDAEFPTVRLGGYERAAVDEYVARARRLVAEMQATRTPEAAVRQALERVGEQISGILQRAHETADSVTAQSRSEAEDRMEEARREAAALIAAAEERVRELDADADRIWSERRRIVEDAHGLAAQLRDVAVAAAERFPEEAGADDAADPGPAAHAVDAALAPPGGSQGDATVRFQVLPADEPAQRAEPSASPGPARGPRTHVVPPDTDAAQRRPES